MDYSQEESTLIEFRLQPSPGGTLLTVTESGFDKVPAERRAEALLRNDGGWAQQMKNIQAYVTKAPSSARAKAAIFAALGDETRLSLLARLCSGQRYSIAELTEGTKLTRQAVTKHLRVLERVRIVHGTREGRQSLFQFDPHPVIEMKEYLELVSKQWDIALARLKSFAESDPR